MKTLWIVSAGIEAVPAIRRAREMGFHVVVSDGDPEAPGFAWANDCIIASIYDALETLDAAHRYCRNKRTLDGVICVAADAPLTAATLAEDFGLPGISVKTARLTTDKLAMKQCLLEAGIPVPWFAAVDSVAELRRIVGEKPLPLVLKPVDSRGARGVLKLTPDTDLSWAFDYSTGFSATGRLIIEDYLSGPQISTESILCEGRAVTPGFSDRNYDRLEEFAPHFIENGGQQPTRLSGQEQRSVMEVAEQAATVLGIENGTSKGDMVLTAEGPKVIEIASRLSGGWFCTHQIPMATGVDFLGAALRLAVGGTIGLDEVRPQRQGAVAIRYFFASPGKITAIQNVDQFRQRSWVRLLKIFSKPGDFVEPVTDHTRRSGFVLTVGETRQQAVERAEQVTGAVRIETVRP